MEGCVGDWLERDRSAYRLAVVFYGLGWDKVILYGVWAG